MTAFGPVVDWATDLDHADPAYNRHAPQIWRTLREGGCPVAHSDRYHGMWIPLTHAYVAEIAYDTERFTSRGVVVSRSRMQDFAEPPIGAAPPITSDPPFHQHARRILLPPFAPKAIAAWEPEVRACCRRLAAAIADRGGEFDGATEYAQDIPVYVIASMLGLPGEDGELFRGFVHDALEAVDAEPEVRAAASDRLGEYLQERVAEHEDERRDDLISYLLDVELFGERLSTAHVVGTLVLLLIAGIDTTWSAIGSSLWHLATHPGDRRRLVADPALLPTAVEELLRAYAPVTMARFVARDHDFHGHAMKAGDWVLLPFPAANRDPAAFDRADEVIIDRRENRHAAFGLGIHRCVGSNLARLEMRVALEELLAQVPDFELADQSGESVVWSVGQVRGPRRLPLRVV
jgi:cytochrome P450